MKRPSMPYMRKDEEEDDYEPRLNTRSSREITNGKGEYYTGNKSKNLLVHIMQKGIEIDKPIKAKIYEQSVEWHRRQWPIVPQRFLYDYGGVAHQYVDVNDVSVLTIDKDHTDTCRKCGGKMTVDAKESRALGRRGIFHAIWGLDNTHMILLIVFAIGAMAMAGAFFWSYNQDTLHKTQLESAQTKIKELNAIINPPVEETPPAPPPKR